MGLIESILGYAKNLIVIENKVTSLHQEIGTMASTMEALTDKLAQLSERLAKVEGKFEAYETMATRIEQARKEIQAPQGASEPVTKKRLK